MRKFRTRVSPDALGHTVAVEIGAQHARLGIASPWVFSAPRERRKSTDPVYSAQALWWALTEAEKRAGIEHKANRGAQKLRRMLAGTSWR
jgi:hypothetical protein